MTRTELDSLYETLRNDVSSLVDTTGMRVKKDKDGRLFVAEPKPVESNEQRVKRILGALCPVVGGSVSFYSGLFYDVLTGSMPEEFRAIENELERQDRSCVTQNLDVRMVMLLLREEGVIEYGKTPLCGNGDAGEFLKDLISASDIPYKDTMLAIIEDQRGDDKPLFIDDDPLESPGEKLDRGVLLLSLLSPEEIYEYGGEVSIIGLTTQGLFCQPLNSSLAQVLPLFYLGSPKVKELFNCVKFKDGWASPENKAKEVASALLPYLDDDARPLAMDDPYYRNVLRQCLRAGVSISDWLYRWDVAMKESSVHCRAWIFEHFDGSIAEMIMANKDYYLIVLDENSRNSVLHGTQYLPFRKYIIDNGLLSEVHQMVTTPPPGEPEEYITFLEIQPQTDQQIDAVRFFNGDVEDPNTDDSKKGPSVNEMLFAFDPSQKSVYYRFIPFDKIVREGYSLDMDRYNAREYHQYKNPVKLYDILTLLKGESKRVLPFKNEIPYGPSWDTYAYVWELKNDALENYGESKHGSSPEWIHDGDAVVDHASALLLKSSWPMQPTWIDASPKGNRKEHTMLVLQGDLVRDEFKAFAVDTTKADPWYVAYQISQRTWQFRLRAGEDGRITDEQFLRMYIDLPSLEEQRAIVENVISEEIERKKKQVGAVDTLFDLAHLIGSPANKVQALLGNLIEMCGSDVEKTTQLKMVGDNFDYIRRIIETTSQDFENWKGTLKEKRILPIIERCVASSASLPFGLVPRLDSSRVDGGITAKVNDTLFAVVFDNIMRNAYRHGFNKTVSADHKVLVSLDIVKHEGKDHLLMSVCNNGNKLEEGFSVYDFVTRGRKGRATGNTGQGGYDVYQIVKKFDGHLGLRSSSDWNFIIDILIPVSGTDPEKQYEEYGYGTLI